MLMKSLCVNLINVFYFYACYLWGEKKGSEASLFFLSEKIQKLNLPKKYNPEVTKFPMFCHLLSAVYKSLYCFAPSHNGFSQNSKGIIDFIG